MTASPTAAPGQVPSQINANAINAPDTASTAGAVAPIDTPHVAQRPRRRK